MAKAKARMREHTDLMLGSAKFKGKIEFVIPNFFDGTLDGYIGYLKYLKQQSEFYGFDVLIHLEGKVKINAERE